MIPKIIHYCWFGGGEKNPKILDCMASWKKRLPDFEIREWNEQNFDIHCCAYVEEAYAAGKYAFVSDYARLYALYHEGGVYLDTDIEILKSFEALLRNRRMVLGFEDGEYVLTAFMAAEPGLQCFEELLASYAGKRFLLENGKPDLLPNPVIVTEAMRRFGLQANGKRQAFGEGFEIFPPEVFSAYNIAFQRLEITADTMTVHHCMGTWQTSREKLKPWLKSVLLRMFGERAFNFFKARLYKKKGIE